MLYSRKTWLAAAAVGAATSIAPTVAHAQLSYALHLEGSAARMLGDSKGAQFGWGGGGLAAIELTLNDRVGLELPVGGLVLSDGTVDPDGLTPTQGGYGLFALPGVRVRPFGRPDPDAVWSAGGLWAAGGGGIAYTGELVRPAVDARLGFDFLPGDMFRVGPSVGYIQIIDTTSMVFPEDARMVLLGMHAAFEPRALPVVPSLDRDHDGILDRDDACPTNAEDLDQFHDEDGCPDNDNDEDTIADEDDHCPLAKEDFDGFEDDDGCPDADNDGDQIPDAQDQCPLVAEDRDDFQDGDGCPEKDNDEDGYLDENDGCPDDPETFNDYADEDGCPDEVQVRMVGSEILLDDRVHFAVDTAFVERRSHPLLGRLAKLMNDNPRWTKVRIQGHADDTGPDSYNERLSLARAKAVMRLLVQLGVAEDRLVIEAYGERKPAVTGVSPEARTRNRRVEFLILERRRAR